MNCCADGLEAEVALHCQGEFANQIARVRRDHRRTDNLIRAFANVNPHEPFGLLIQNGAVHFAHFDRDLLLRRVE